MATTVRKSDKQSGRYPGSKPVQKVRYNGSTVLYGRSGTGKTTLASTWPKPILYLNINDNGTDSIADVEDIDVYDITASEELRDIILWIHAEHKAGTLKYKTVVLDTMTQLQSILLREFGEANKDRKKIKGSSKKRLGDFGTLTKQDWGTIAGDLKAAVIDIRNLPIESVFIAQDRTFNATDDEADDADEALAPEVGPRLMPSVASEMNASVSIIGNTFIRVKHTKKKVDGKFVYSKKMQFCLRLGPSDIFVTKIRKPKGVEAPDYIVDPTHEKLLAVISGEE
jgi:hypothetical protein